MDFPMVVDNFSSWNELRNLRIKGKEGGKRHVS
jgi:hypothetical protein